MADTETNTLVFHSVPGGSETAFIAFSAALGAKPGRFHFFGLVSLFPEASKLLIRERSANWYNAGLPGIGDTVEEIAEWIRRELAALGARRIVTVGSSLGAYAAILFGCMIGAERAIAFAPRTVLDPNLPAPMPPAQLNLQVPDLEPVMREAPRTKVDLLTGWDKLLDVFHVQRVASVPSARVLAMPAVGHLMAKELKDQGLLWPLIEELAQGNTPSICTVKPEFEPATVQRLSEAAFAWKRGDWSAVVNAIAPVGERHRDWAAPHFALAKALSQLGYWEGAENALEAAMSANPGRIRPRIERAMTLIEKKQLAEARNALRSAIMN